MPKLLALPNPFGGTVWYKEETESTMLDSEELLTAGEPAGSLVVADFQRQGRGRFEDRRWETRPGEALLFTIALPARHDFPLSLRAALGVSFYLESLGFRPLVKWPNDVLLDGSKVCGILVQGNGRHHHLGIGLNLGQRHFPQDRLRRPATSLALHGFDKKNLEVLAALLPFLHSAVRHPNIRDELEKRLWSLGETMELAQGNGSPPLKGRVLGLEKDGALLLETSSGVRRFYSGE